MSSPLVGLVATTGQASLALLDARPDPQAPLPVSNTTHFARRVAAASMPNGVLIWDADQEQFHLYTDMGLFIFRRNEIVWPDGTALRGEDVSQLLAAQDCGP